MNVGDIVELKSGGPPMTVVAKMDDGKFLSCWWFNMNKDLCSQVFQASLIQPRKRD